LRAHAQVDASRGLQSRPSAISLPFLSLSEKKLIKYKIPDLESLKCATAYFVEIGQETPATAFEIGIKRDKWGIEHKGEYFRN
jgi:hypothetical protein